MSIHYDKDGGKRYDMFINSPLRAIISVIFFFQTNNTYNSLSTTRIHFNLRFIFMVVSARGYLTARMTDVIAEEQYQNTLAS